MVKRIRLFARTCVVLAMALLTACSDNDGGPVQERLPVVFVHGQFGSAQQFETQAMRFTSNGYPQDLLYAFEYDTSKTDNPLADLDSFIEEVRRETGATQVYAVGHSRGTSMWTEYLDDPAFNGPAKVARYVNIDGRYPEELPGGVPTIGIWGEWNSADSGYNRREDNGNSQIGPDPSANYYFPNKSHTETATSAEAFAVMYRFLTGVEARTTDVKSAKSGKVNVAGRALYFPENVSFAGATLQLWKIDAASGQRVSDQPVQTMTTGPSGEFGPLKLDPKQHYEFALLRPATDTFPADSVHHFYSEPYTHDNYFVRLLSSQPGQGIEEFIPVEEASSGMVVLRMREFWGDQGAAGDELFIDGLNVLTPAIAPRTGVNIAVFMFDQDSDQTTDLEKGEIFPLNLLTFLTGADVFIPAMFEGAGSVEVSLVNRGGETTVLNIPNWPSSTNRISVMFRDDTP
jgi:pimeloyl-ACP methyl ester carboxylesterase